MKVQKKDIWKRLQFFSFFHTLLTAYTEVKLMYLTEGLPEQVKPQSTLLTHLKSQSMKNGDMQV